MSQQSLNNSNSLHVKKNPLLFLGIILISFNLRPAITSIGPIVGDIRSDLDLSNISVGMITTLPLIAFAVLSPLAPKIAQRFGFERTIFVGLIALVIGVFLRWFSLPIALFGGTALVGIGIASSNVLLPGVIKEKFPKNIGLMTGIYTSLLYTGAALASGVSVPLAHGLNLGWRLSLLIWGVTALFALVLWTFQLRGSSSKNLKNKSEYSVKSIWGSALAWQVTFFMGLTSFSFYVIIAWLPEILQNNGMSLATAGWTLSAFQIVGIPTSFITPMIAERLKNQQLLILILGLTYIIGLIGLLTNLNNITLIIGTILMGLAQGASLSVAYSLFGMRTSNSNQAAQLSGMAQTLGYVLAATGPIFIGFLFDFKATSVLPLYVLLIAIVCWIIAGLGAGRDKHVTTSF